MTDPHGNNPEEDPEEHIGEPAPDPWDESDDQEIRDWMNRPDVDTSTQSTVSRWFG
jgi:hypothetical protein